MMSLPHPVRSAGRGLLAAAVGIALVVPTVQADGSSIWRECAAGNGVSTNHSQADFQNALSNPPADGNEYSDCADQIHAAQLKASRAGSSGGSGGTGGSGGAGGSSGTPSSGATAAPAVAPGALSSALKAKGVDPNAAVTAPVAPPAPVQIAGKTIDLNSGRLPSLGGALSLPLPLAASAVVVMLSAALPVVRYLVARFGGPPTGTSPAP